MAYNEYEIGATSGRPLELYEFDGTYNDYYMTSYGQEVISLGRRYEAYPIKRNPLSLKTQDNGEKALEISIPFDHPLVTEYAYQNAPPDLSFTLYRAHQQDPDDRVKLWEGKVTGFTVEGRIARLKVPATFSYILQGNTPTPRFQAPCNHVLYDARCGVDPSLHQHTTTVLNVTDTDITIAAPGFADGAAVAGIMFTASGEARMIISNVGTAIQVSYPFSGLEVGQSVTLRKGCDHALQGDCINKFSNGARFGGFPIVPDRNPFTSTLT